MSDHDPRTTPKAADLRDLDDAECWALLGTHTIGRLAWLGPAGITVVPVNYRIVRGEIVLRTTAFSAVARECDDSPVAFQVDLVDPGARSGWSVLARGIARFEVARPGGPDDEVDVWPAGHRPLTVHIEVTGVSGRQLPPA